MAASLDNALALDPSALGGLKLAARREDPGAVREAAEQFEALLLQRMLSEMRAASGGDDLLGSSQLDGYYDMFDRQVAQDLVRHGGLGLADQLVGQLEGAARRGAAQETAGPAANPHDGRLFPVE